MNTLVLIPIPTWDNPIPLSTTMAIPLEVDIITAQGRLAHIQLNEAKFEGSIYKTKVTEPSTNYFADVQEGGVFSRSYLKHKGVVSYEMIFDILQHMNINERPYIYYRFYDPKFEESSEIISNFLSAEGLFA